MAESEQSKADKVYSSVLNYSPIITKVDAPVEDTTEGKLENEKNECKLSNEEFNICRPSTPPKMDSSNNSFAITNKFIKPGILKPPQLKPFILNPCRLNPFARLDSNSNSNNAHSEEKTTVNGESVKFVPLVQENIANNSQSRTNPSNVANTISSNSFVFGQNLQDRVVASETTNDPTPSTSITSNGASDMLFSNAIKNDVKPGSSVSDNSNKEAKSLSESAREYEQSRASKRKYEEVEVKTGEEEETNILSISCKLFSYDSITGSWQERGRGTMRLNDFFGENNRRQSRLVFRTSGSLRVILNTKIFAKMTAEKASDKSIRLTALDANGEIKIFLVMTTIEDSKILHSHLFTRINKVIEAQKEIQGESQGLDEN